MICIHLKTKIVNSHVFTILKRMFEVRNAISIMIKITVKHNLEINMAKIIFLSEFEAVILAICTPYIVQIFEKSVAGNFLIEKKRYWKLRQALIGYFFKHFSDNLIYLSDWGLIENTFYFSSLLWYSCFYPKIALWIFFLWFRDESGPAPAPPEFADTPPNSSSSLLQVNFIQWELHFLIGLHLACLYDSVFVCIQ